MSATTKLSTKSRLGPNWSQTDTKLQRPQSSNVNVKTLRLSESEIGLKKLRYWVRRNALSSEDAFIVLSDKALGYCNHLTKLSLDNFITGINKIPIEMNSLQVIQLRNLDFGIV